ncbi:MAG TPA: DUF177 domain-containing protein [Thermoanaerobaculia bacterium]|jgi:uncharacterized protein
MNDVIDFTDIDEHGPQSYRGKFDVPPSELDRPELESGGTVEIDATVRVGDVAGEYVAEGTSKVTADLNCSRCVEAYPFANASPFHVRFRPRPETSPDSEEVEITDKEELDVEFYSERVFPLRDLAVEQIQLSIPMKPLCDESCLGLCPTCGANKAREGCRCGSSIVDERWGALKAIGDQLKKKEV